RQRDQMLALTLVKARRTGNGEIVGRGGAGGPHDFLRIGIDQPRHLLACQLYSFLGFPTIPVRAAGRIAETFIQIRHHLSDNAWVYRGSGGVVEIDGSVHRRLPGWSCTGYSNTRSEEHTSELQSLTNL